MSAPWITRRYGRMMAGIAVGLSLILTAFFLPARPVWFCPGGPNSFFSCIESVDHRLGLKLLLAGLGIIAFRDDAADRPSLESLTLITAWPVGSECHSETLACSSADSLRRIPVPSQHARRTHSRLLDPELIQPRRPQHVVRLLAGLSKGRLDAGPLRPVGENLSSLRERFQWPICLDEQIHLTGSEVVPIDTAELPEPCLQHVRHVDERLEVGLA